MPTVIDCKLQKPLYEFQWHPMVPTCTHQFPSTSTKNLMLGSWKRRLETWKEKDKTSIQRAILRILYSIFILLLVDPPWVSDVTYSFSFSPDVFFFNVGLFHTWIPDRIRWDAAGHNLKIGGLDLYNWWAGPQKRMSIFFENSEGEKRADLQNAQVFIVKHDICDVENE